jgi:hypothetical protein
MRETGICYLNQSSREDAVVVAAAAFASEGARATKIKPTHCAV